MRREEATETSDGEAAVCVQVPVDPVYSNHHKRQVMLNIFLFSQFSVGPWSAFDISLIESFAYLIQARVQRFVGSRHCFYLDWHNRSHLRCLH